VSVESDYFDQEIEYYDRYGSKLWPAVVINNQTFRGQLEVEGVMNAICAGFADTPKMCRRALGSQNSEDASIIFDFDTEELVPVHHITAVIVFTMMTVTCVLCMYRRQAKR